MTTNRKINRGCQVCDPKWVKEVRDKYNKEVKDERTK